MRYLAAILPILLVLALMIRFRWGAHKAGGAGLLAAVIVGAVGFGLTPEVLWVSQAKGVLLSVFVLWVMWPALWLYHWLDQNGGISSAAKLLEATIPDKGMCRVLLAWSLSGLLEGIAGFGLPVAVVAPMLVALGVPGLRSVAAVAVGHSWAVTFGDMGVILQTLSAVVSTPAAEIVPWAGILLGFACLLCGLLSASVLGELRQWPKIVALSAVIATVQYGLAAIGLVPLSAFGAGLSGLLGYIAIARLHQDKTGRQLEKTEIKPELSPVAVGQVDFHQIELPVGNSPSGQSSTISTCPALLAISCYGGVTLLLAAATMIVPLHRVLQDIVWKPLFAAVTTLTGFSTPAGPGQVFRPLAHPGTLIFLVTCVSVALFRAVTGGPTLALRAVQATVRSAGLVSVGIILMVGMATLMDHCGMSYLLAEGLSGTIGAAFPIVSPAVGILGAFATGSNNNSNVLFGSLQKSVAGLLNVQPQILLAAQTAGGSLGSMLAPAKIIVGCSTVGEIGREGTVLRKTVPLGLACGLAVGLLTLLLSRLR